eukprot:maker-scaffold_3-snap-gene-3.6-mRNA-1 protein AED:0.13 eAED:0.22 QI:0/0/0/0.5/1/1/2/0/247
MILRYDSRILQQNTKLLEGIKRKNLHLNIDKCQFINDNDVFCGHKLTQKGHTLDDSYVKDLINRKCPQCTYELAQMIFAINWIAGVLPGFSKVETLITIDSKITGKIKLLERKRIPIKWTDTFKDAYNRFIELLEDSLHTTLGYYDPRKDIVILVDASERFWSYYICQTDEEIHLKNPILTSVYVVAMSSGSFKGSQLDRHISIKELFPVIEANRKFAYMLNGNFKRKILFTDHKKLGFYFKPAALF